MICTRILSALLLIPFACSGIVLADEPASDVAVTDLAQWIADLDADDYATRQSAQKKLEKAGESGIEAVTEAALGDSQEAASRAIDILRKHSQSNDKGLSKSATATLEKLAEGENAIVAERAANALKPKVETPEEPQEQVRPAGPRVIPFGGRGGIRIEAHAIQIGGGARKVSIKNVDGNKEIDVEEKGRKIKIIESADGKIKMKIEGPKDDMDGSKEVAAENAEELKKVDPEAHKLYEKYSQGIGGGRIEFKALPARPRIRIAPALPKDVVPEADRIEIEERFEEALKRIEKVQEEFEIEIAPADGEEARLKALQKVREQLEKQLEDVKKQIEDAQAE